MEIILLNVTQSKELNANYCLIRSPSLKFVIPECTWSSWRIMFMLLSNVLKVCMKRDRMKHHTHSNTDKPIQLLSPKLLSTECFRNIWLQLYVWAFRLVTKLWHHNKILDPSTMQAFPLYTHIKKAAAGMWQVIVSIIKMTLQFLWEQVLHKVTATPCH